MALIGILQMIYQDEDFTIDRKSLASHCTSIRKNFKVQVKESQNSYEVKVYIAMLAHDEQLIQKTFDRIMDHTESSGFARIDSHDIMIDSTDAIFDREEYDYGDAGGKRPPKPGIADGG